MKILRILLFPIVPIYFVITWLRNWFYDKAIFKAMSYDFPVICVGNLSTGGTGKTPMIEYLIRLLSKNNRIATLSRGYKRVTNGFVLADENANVDTIGDEPFQFYNKFQNIIVAVDENRQHGIKTLRNINPQPNIVLLDDAYQHRKVKAGFNILLTAFNAMYFNDIVLPTGNLREPKSGVNRADIIVVTKCPEDLSEQKKEVIKRKINLKTHQNIFFSSIKYSEKIYAVDTESNLDTFNNFTLVTGIANATSLVDFLKSKHLNFEHLEYGDHHNFTMKDIELLQTKDLILTTEKDYMRLLNVETLNSKLFYIPIEIKIDNAKKFEGLIKTFTN